MRISDWSSDVCSSDLAQVLAGVALLAEADLQQQAAAGVVARQAGGLDPMQGQLLEGELDHRRGGLAHEALARVAPADPVADARYEEGLVGKEGVSTCRSRWLPVH